MKRYWPVAFLFLALFAISPGAATAQEPQVTVSNNAPYPLLVNGQEVERLPVTAPVGSRVCVITNPAHLNDVERLVFKGWSHGSPDECVILNEPGAYAAQYTSEVLLQVRSEVKT